MFKTMEGKTGTCVGFVGTLVACVLLLPALCGGAETRKDIDLEALRSMVESFAATIAATSEDNAALRREIASLREELALVRGIVLQKGEAGGTQPSAVGNAAMLREMQSTEEVQRIVSLLRTMKNAAFMYYLYEIMPIREDSTRVNSAKVDYANFRDKVNHDPLAVRNILGKYLDAPETFDETCHFYVLEDDRWLVGYDLAGEDESTLERLAAMARQSERPEVRRVHHLHHHSLDRKSVV